MRISSPAFKPHSEIPERYTCEGEDVCPPLDLDVDIHAAESLAIVVDDPDAPKKPWVHLVMYNLPPISQRIEEGAPRATLPPSVRFGLNDWKRAGWGGPCPPSGRHRYVFTLFALDAFLPDLGDATRDDLVRAMAGHVLGEAVLVATYQLKRPSRGEARHT